MRQRHLIRPVERCIQIPEDIDSQVRLMLFSEVEGRVPYGALSRHIVDLLREDLRKRQAQGAQQ